MTAPDRDKRILELLRKLDAEHSHQEPCETCAFVEAQPEWPEIVEARQHDE